VLSVHVFAAVSVDFVTPEGTVPPNAWTEPKLADTAELPLPDKTMPLPSVANFKLRICAEHWQAQTISKIP
jgi:hypothetical protein